MVADRFPLRSARHRARSAPIVSSRRVRHQLYRARAATSAAQSDAITISKQDHVARVYRSWCCFYYIFPVIVDQPEYIFEFSKKNSNSACSSIPIGRARTTRSSTRSWTSSSSTIRAAFPALTRRANCQAIERAARSLSRGNGRHIHATTRSRVPARSSSSRQSRAFVRMRISRCDDSLARPTDITKRAISADDKTRRSTTQSQLQAIFGSSPKLRHLRLRAIILADNNFAYYTWSILSRHWKMASQCNRVVVATIILS